MNLAPVAERYPESDARTVIAVLGLTVLLETCTAGRFVHHSARVPGVLIW